MDINSIAGSAAALSAAQTGSEIGIKVLKEAQEQSGNSLQLINSLASSGGGSVGPQGEWTSKPKLDSESLKLTNKKST